MNRTLLGLLLLVPACSTAGGQDNATPGTRGEAVYTEVVRRAAAEYRTWGVVGPHVLWAPTLCVAPPPPSMHTTEAVGLDVDGHKLFALYASDAKAYLELTTSATDGAAPVGMTLVKEAYTPVPVPLAEVPHGWSPEARARIDELGFYPFAKKGDEVFTAGPRRDLFVMTKLGPEAEDTDGGWVYGTVTPAGAVTSAGRVGSCMECHETAPTDRLFGVAFGR